MTRSEFFLPTPEKFKHYEELEGAKGKEIRYRARRFKVEHVFEQLKPDIKIREFKFPLIDFSASGIAFQHPSDLPKFSIGSEILLAINYEDVTLFESKCVVVRQEELQNGSKIAAQLQGNHLDVEELVDCFKKAVLTTRLQQIANPRDIIQNVPEQYRIFCQEVVFLLREYRDILEDYEKTVETKDQYSESSPLSICEASILNPWKEFIKRGNFLVKPYLEAGNKTMLRALKKYTECFVTPEFMEAAFWVRSYKKPLGYPGDYGIMQYIYDQGRYGDSLYAKLTHFLGVEMGEFVRNRIKLTRSFIDRTIFENQESVYITNVGCGIAYEISSYLEITAPLSKNVTFTLIDQDIRALELAYLAVQRLTIQHYPYMSVKAFNTTFRKLIRPSEMLTEIPKQHLIYSLGILDYLPPKKAKQFIHGLFQHLAPGGYLIVANVNDVPHSLMWPLGFILDWELIYRSEAEMYSLCQDLHAADVKVIEDDTQQVLLLVLQKPLEI